MGYAATEPINQGQVGFQTHTFINPDIPLPSVELGESASADTIPSGIIPSHHSTIMTQTNMIPTSFTAAGPYFMNNDAWPQAGFGSMGGNKRKLSDQFEQASVAEKRIFTGRDESGIARGEPEIGLQRERELS